MSYPSPDLLLLTLRLRDARPTKALGQHYLSDEAMLGKFAEAAGLDAATVAVEIGPGPGTLTTMLARRAGRLVAVEFDRRFAAHYENVFGGLTQVEFVFKDALRTDLFALARERMGTAGADGTTIQRAVLAGNLPFQITSPLLFGQCSPEAPWAGMAFMVQKEVADRLSSPPGNKRYGILTVKMAYWWRMTQRFEAPARVFTPQPKVDAAFLVYEPLPAEARPNTEEWESLSRFVDAAFNQRRKMMINSLASAWAAFPGKESALAAMAELGIDAQARAEALSPDQLRALHAALRAAS